MQRFRASKHSVIAPRVLSHHFISLYADPNDGWSGIQILGRYQSPNVVKLLGYACDEVRPMSITFKT